MRDRLSHLFERHFGTPTDAIVRVAADGSQRAYFRLTGGRHQVIGAVGPDRDENRAFLSFSRSFRSIGLPVPEIYAADEGHGIWLSEDLGDTTLFGALSAARGPDAAFPEAILPAYRRVVEILPRFQVEGGRVVDYADAYPRSAFDRQSMLWDLNYFKYHFLKLAHIPFNEQRLENDFAALADFLLDADTSHFLYRDFQSRNIMLRDDEPWFIDYQGGRRGAPQYDIASLLYDAKAAIPEAIRDSLLNCYLAALARLLPFDRAAFRVQYRGYVIIRIMQAMGAYGYRGFYERKPRFLQSVPYAARNIERLLAVGLPVHLPELESVFKRIVEAWADAPGDVAPLPGLTVHITSFSYRQSYPEDHTGHGGGFVFDCRALPNPGRLAEFEASTGRDRDVVHFLEQTSQTERFWQSVVSLVNASVEDYRKRQFADLTVNFGCTGGQHRSVYFAERLARHLRTTFPDVGVRLVHREQDRWPAARETAAQWTR
ncbi:MAG: RapZ C-terminal domain-containing protein [Longimicrobiales bacterium]